MLSRLVQTPNDMAPTIVRAMLGVVIFAHGCQKVLGWFGGGGFDQTMTRFTEAYNIPVGFAFLAIMVEFLGGFCLIVGLFGRIASLGVAVNMIFAIIIVTGSRGFFINWAGTRPAGEQGYEFQLLAIAMGLAIAVRGAGAFSLDRLIYRKLNR
jgi:putative oxidoreductase